MIPYQLKVEDFRKTHPDFDQVVGQQTKEELFARTYLANGMNATEAALAIGLARKSAHVEGSKYLRKPKVQKLLAKLILSVKLGEGK